MRLLTDGSPVMAAEGDDDAWAYEWIDLDPEAGTYSQFYESCGSSLCPLPEALECWGKRGGGNRSNDMLTSYLLEPTSNRILAVCVKECC